jgi:hypothetical protein
MSCMILATEAIVGWLSIATAREEGFQPVIVQRIGCRL